MERVFEESLYKGKCLILVASNSSSHSKCQLQPLLALQVSAATSLLALQVSAATSPRPPSVSCNLAPRLPIVSCNLSSPSKCQLQPLLALQVSAATSPRPPSVSCNLAALDDCRPRFLRGSAHRFSSSELSSQTACAVTEAANRCITRGRPIATRRVSIEYL